MKYIFILLALLTSSCASDRSKRMRAAENNYDAGCLFSALHVCSAYVKEPARYTCYDEMSSLCPESAANFRNWLENGKHD